MSLWAAAPVLGSRASDYLGRVMLEVWSDAAVNTVGDPGLFPQALALLANGQAYVRSTEVPIKTGPIVASRPGAAFRGRVIVEFWKDGALIGIIGDDERILLQGAIKGLTSQVAGS
jgi:hypothetical protein